MSSLWTPEEGGHNDLHPGPPRRRNTNTQPPPDLNSHPPPMPQQQLPDRSKTDEKSTPLFPASLLPASTLSALPESYTLRPLTLADYDLGHLETLKALTSVGEVSREAWERRWRWMKRRNEDDEEGKGKGGEYFVIVVCDGSGKVVGTGTVVVERKFIHDLGAVSHIEDIVVRKDQQGKKLGLRIIEALDHLSKEVGCYKAILDCSDTNEGFYVKCGYERKGLQMAHYYEK